LCSCDSVTMSRDSIFSIFLWCMKYELCMKMKVMLLLSGTYVLNYEHVILYIHMYEPYSCTIKFMLFIICQLLIIAYIIIYIPVQSIYDRFDLSGLKQLNRRFNWFETVGPVNQWTDGLADSISGPVLITLMQTTRRVTTALQVSRPSLWCCFAP
jgi:hypothetical protein